MATRKKTTAVHEIPQQEPEELDAFDRALLEFKDSSGVKLDILRYDRDEGRAKYLKRVDFDPGVMGPEWIRRKWGAGSYQLRFRDSENPDRAWSQVIDIAADENTDQPRGAPAQDTNAPLLSMLQRQNEIMLTALLQNKGGGASDGTAIVKLIEGLNAQNQTMLSGVMNRGDTTGNIITILERGLELAKDAKADSEGGWISQLGRLARDLLPAIQEMQRMRPITVPPMQPAGAPALPSSTAPPPQPPSSPTQPGGVVDTSPRQPGQPPTGGEVKLSDSQILDMSLRQFAPDLISAIEEGYSAEDAAEGILDSIPPRFYPEFKNITTDRVLQMEQRLAPHRGYVDRVIRRLQAESEGDSVENTTDQDNSAPQG